MNSNRIKYNPLVGLGWMKENNDGDESRASASAAAAAFLSVVGFPYKHPTLGKVVLDTEIVELSFLAVIVQEATEKFDPTFLKIDFDKAAFPRSSATGNRPYAIVQPHQRPPKCPPAAKSETGIECPNLLTFPQVIRYARRCARSLIGSETDTFISDSLLEFISERLELVTEYFLWSDALVLEEWTLPVVCSSLPFGFRRYFCWRRRKEWEVKFACMYGKDQLADTREEGVEKFVLGLLSQIVQFVVQSLRTSSYLSGSDKPGILDGVVFSHLSVLLSTPVSDHSGLSPILAESLTGPILREYCMKMNSIVQGGIWPNSDTYLLGLTPSKPPYANNPNSARSQREKRAKAKRSKSTAESPESQQQLRRANSNSSFLMRVKGNAGKLMTDIYRRLTLPSVVNTNQKKETPEYAVAAAVHKGDSSSNSINPELFVAVSAIVLLGFLLSGKSLIQLGSN